MTRRRWWQLSVTKARPNDKCPICDAPVVAAGNSFYSPLGGMVLRRTREELIADCAVHGHSPYNTATVRFLQEEGDEADGPDRPDTP